MMVANEEYIQALERASMLVFQYKMITVDSQFKSNLERLHAQITEVLDAMLDGPPR
jgi:hypothetical protein